MGGTATLGPRPPGPATLPHRNQPVTAISGNGSEDYVSSDYGLGVPGADFPNFRKLTLKKLG
jgi:hypothetical protein